MAGGEIGLSQNFEYTFYEIIRDIMRICFLLSEPGFTGFAALRCFLSEADAPVFAGRWRTSARW
jgi:hypothetical protein